MSGFQKLKLGVRQHICLDAFVLYFHADVCNKMSAVLLDVLSQSVVCLIVPAEVACLLRSFFEPCDSNLGADLN